MDGTIPLIPLIVVLGCSAIAAFTDISRFKVYNFVTIPCFLCGLIYGVASHGLEGLGFAVAGSMVGFFILLIPYLMGGLGAGDVKFVMAIGSWIGALYLLPAIIVGCVVIFGYFLIIVARKDGFKGVLYNIQLMFMRLSCFGRNLALNDQFESVQSVAHGDDSQKRGRLIPFSAMMSLGIVFVLFVMKYFGEP